MSTEKKIIFFKKKFDKQIKYLILLIMANINNTEKNQEATVSFDPWADHTDAELDAMAEAYADREHGRDSNPRPTRRVHVVGRTLSWGLWLLVT